MMKQFLDSYIRPAGTGIFLFLALILFFGGTRPAAAGGWAVVSLDSLPDAVTAGEPLHLEITVLQHGVTPVHTIGEEFAVTPQLSATHVETGEVVRVEAVPAKETGRFTLDVTFPTAGTWEWSITPAPLSGETAFAPLNVNESMPVAAGASTNNSMLTSPAMSMLGSIGARIVLAAAGGVLLFIAFRNRKGREKESIPVSNSPVQ